MSDVTGVAGGVSFVVISRNGVAQPGACTQSSNVLQTSVHMSCMHATGISDRVLVCSKIVIAKTDIVQCCCLTGASLIPYRL